MFRRAAICLVLSACGGGDSTGIDISALECPTDSTLTYQTFGQTFFNDNCLQCHAGRESPRLDTTDKIRANKQRILEAAVGSTFMPEGKDISLDERQLLGEWLACGAPD